ncbi:MAG: hypothetical protein WCW02_00390 [Candidatus Buchananbacteria bacterium]
MREFNFSNNLPNFSDESLKLVAFCPVCQMRYNPLQAQVVSEREGAHLLHIKCHNCYSSILALILANNFGVSSVGLITDLDGSEVIKFKDYAQISDDEVLALEEVLAKAEQIF